MHTGNLTIEYVFALFMIFSKDTIACTMEVHVHVTCEAACLSCHKTNTH